MKSKPGHTTVPETVAQAWLNLAADVLLLAIEDVRQNRDRKKREEAKAWLLSPAAALIFDAVLNPAFDVSAWVKANCPVLDNE